MIKNSYDAVVVGGGPAGSMAAWEIAKAGFSVCILEKTTDIGYPVRCGEAIGYTGLNQFVTPKKSWINASINSINLVAPNSKNVKIKFKKETGFILNRKIFDYELSNLAKNDGAEVFTKAYVSGLLFNNNYISGIKLDYLGTECNIKANIVIGADGIESRVGRWAGIRTNVKMKDMESCVQYTMSNIHVNNNEMIMYVGKKYAPGGYLWIFPKGDSIANVGIGISGKYSEEKSAKSYLDNFIKKKYPNASIVDKVCGGVICAKPHVSPIENGLMLVGDAAHQTNPMTGGGIASGMRGGQIAGIVASDALNNKDYSKKFLKKYPEKMFKSFGNNYTKLHKIKDTINQLTDDNLNSIADSVIQIPVEKRSLATIFMKAVRHKPSLMVDVMKIFAGF